MGAEFCRPGQKVFGVNGEIGIVEQVSISHGHRDFSTATATIRMMPSIPVGSSAWNGDIYDGASPIFGIPPKKKPYRGTIIGNVKIKYRNNNFAKVYIRDPYRIREFILVEDGEYVTHGIEQAVNERKTPRTKQ